MVKKSIESIFLVSQCQTLAKTLGLACQRKATKVPSTLLHSFLVLNPFTVWLPVSPTWKWTLPGPLSTRCSIATLLLWESLNYHLVSPSRKTIGWVWWVAPMLPACHLLVSVRLVVFVVEVEEVQISIVTLQGIPLRGVDTITTAPADPVVLAQKMLSIWWLSEGRDLKKDHSYVSARITIVSHQQAVPETNLEYEEEVGDINISPSGSVPGQLQIWTFRTPGLADALVWTNTPGTPMMTMTGAPLAPRPPNQTMKDTFWVSLSPDPCSCATSATRSLSISTTAQAWEDLTTAGSYIPANAEKVKTALSPKTLRLFFKLTSSMLNRKYRKFTISVFSIVEFWISCNWMSVTKVVGKQCRSNSVCMFVHFNVSEYLLSV